MFWIGFIVGFIIALAAAATLLWYCCWKTYGTVDTFNAMVNVTQIAANNRESRVEVWHDGECLDMAIFEEE